MKNIKNISAIVIVVGMLNAVTISTQCAHMRTQQVKADRAENYAHDRQGERQEHRPENKSGDQAERYDLKTLCHLIQGLHTRMDVMEQRVQALLGALGTTSEDDSVVEVLRKIKTSVDDIEETAASTKTTAASSMALFKQVGALLIEMFGDKVGDFVGILGSLN